MEVVSSACAVIDGVGVKNGHAAVKSVEMSSIYQPNATSYLYGGEPS